MTPRLLFSGHNISYGRLLDLRSKEEAIIAVWRRDFVNTAHAQRIASEKDYLTIAGLTKNGFYVDLRWYGSAEVSTNPVDYAMLE